MVDITGIQLGVRGGTAGGPQNDFSEAFSYRLGHMKTTKICPNQLMVAPISMLYPLLSL